MSTPEPDILLSDVGVCGDKRAAPRIQLLLVLAAICRLWWEEAYISSTFLTMCHSPLVNQMGVPSQQAKMCKSKLQHYLVVYGGDYENVYNTCEIRNDIIAYTNTRTQGSLTCRTLQQSLGCVISSPQGTQELTGMEQNTCCF